MTSDEIEKFAAWLETGTVDHICRLTNAAFNNPGERRPQFTIPADPERDSDLRATRDLQEAAALIRRLRDERDAARLAGKIEGMEAIAEMLEDGYDRPVGKSWFPDGRPNKNDKCPHEVWMYEECQACDIAAIRAKIAELQATTTPASPGSSEEIGI